ncbi:MAG: hypothetical protein ACRDJ9_15070 [Dehalococcoidia bacterium]
MNVTTRGWLVALVAVSALVGAAAYSPRPAAAALNGATTCTPNRPGTTTTSCTLNFTESFVVPPGVFFPVTMTGPAQFNPLNPPTVAAAAGCVTPPTITMVTASSYRIVVQAGGCLPGANFVVTEPVIVSANGVLQQTVTSPFLDPPLIVTAPVSFTPPATALSATKSCGPAVLPIPADAFTCTFTITNNTAILADPLNQPEYVVQIAGPGTLADHGGGNPFSGSALVSANVNCPASVRTVPPLQPAATSYRVDLDVSSCAPGSSITVTETITPSAGGVLSQTVSRRDGATATATASIGAGFTRAGDFDIRCPSSLNPNLVSTTYPLVTLGPLGDGEPIAIGVLPAVLICDAAFYDAAGDRARVAPGTIEISSSNGTFVDLNGGLATNLRIACDRAARVTPSAGQIVHVNTCQGVRFGVLGLGVGFVELRARYEPSSAAAAAGIHEADVARDAAFVAPPVSLSLFVSPNPVAVGANGRATLRFNRAVTFASDLLVNPETGAPLFVNSGTPLNGTVTFTSSVPNVAAFTDGIAAGEQVVTGTVPGANQQGVTVRTAATARVRCGSVMPAVQGAATAVTVANFRTFFGGCDSVAVRYRGVSQGTTIITAMFVADLPGAFGAVGVLAGNVQALVDRFSGVSTNSITRTLEVVESAAATQRLVPGCNNVVAPADESVQQVAARVDPAVAISIWRQTPGTARFQGAAVGGNVPASVSNLTGVNALDAIFICAGAAATYRMG